MAVGAREGLSSSAHIGWRSPVADQFLDAAQARPALKQGPRGTSSAYRLPSFHVPGCVMWHRWRSFFFDPSTRWRVLLVPPCPAYQPSRLKPVQLAAMLRIACGDFYADISAYGRKHFVCEVYMEGGEAPLIVEQAGDLEEAQQVARRHLDTVRNTELLWAAQGRKGPAIAKSEELLREAFETLRQYTEEMEL